MLKLTVSAVFILLACQPARADCDLAAARDLHAQSWPETAEIEFTSVASERSDGATWSIERGPDRKPRRFMHQDYGEGGKDIRTLTVADSGSYLITRHTDIYAGSRDDMGSFTRREEIDHYSFCAGKLELPENSDMDLAYVEEAKKIAAFFFESAELQPYVSDAGLKPPSWQ